ncbi:glycosyltransferase family 4 protein [Geodermatophilus sp. SYSU D00684]
MSGGHRVLVANMGTHPELQHAARELAAQGLLSGYRTSLGWSEDGRMARGRLPGPARSMVDRRLLAGLSPQVVRRRGAALELAYQVFIRTRYRRTASRFLHARTMRFDRAVARELARRARPDLVLAQGTGATALLTAADRRGIPTVLNCPIAHHRWMERYLADEPARNPAWAGTLQHHVLDETWADHLDEELSLASVLLVASSFCASTYIAEGVDPSKIRILPLGVDLPEDVPERPVRPDGPLRVLFAGMLTQRKGLSYLFEAFEAADLPAGSRLVLAGRPIGDAADVCRRYPWVDVLGSLPKGELEAEYRRADVFVLPSLIEGFGLVGIEAMAHGLPVVVSTHTFGEDVVSDGKEGFVVPAGEAAPLARALTELGRSPELRAQMGRAAAERARDFTWDAYGTRLVEVLRSADLL